MVTETKILMRTLLYQISRAKSLKEAIDAVEMMCEEDDIAIVEKKLRSQESKPE